jgi:hypothetical protein
MGVPPAKLHEKPAKANKWGTRSEHAAGFFDPVWMGLRPAKFREKPAEANKCRTWGEEAAGFFAPVAASRHANFLRDECVRYSG